MNVLILNHREPMKVFNSLVPHMKKDTFYSFRDEGFKNMKKIEEEEIYDIRNLYKKYKIDVVFGDDTSMVSFWNKPFSSVAKKMGIPYAIMFDGVLDETPTGSGSKFSFLGKVLKDENFHNYYIKVFRKNLGFLRWFFYSIYSFSPFKNRYKEDGLYIFTGGDYFIERFNDKLELKKVKKIGLPQLDAQLNTKGTVREKKGQVLLISQPLQKEFVVSKEEEKNLLLSIENFARDNPKCSIVVRPHPREDPALYKKLQRVENITVDSKKELNKQIRESEYVMIYFSTVIFNALYFKKKIIIYNFLHKFSKSIFINRLLYNCSELKDSTLKEVDDFYKGKGSKKMEDFLHYLNYTNDKETSIRRFINETRSLVNKGD